MLDRLEGKTKSNDTETEKTYEIGNKKYSWYEIITLLCNGYGNYCVVNHGSLKINGNTSNYVAYYAHAQKIIVSQGQYVKQGQILGYVGTTGWSTGYHLHFGMLKNGSWINPYPLFF